MSQSNSHSPSSAFLAFMSTANIPDSPTQTQEDVVMASPNRSPEMSRQDVEALFSSFADAIDISSSPLVPDSDSDVDMDRNSTPPTPTPAMSTQNTRAMFEQFLATQNIPSSESDSSTSSGSSHTKGPVLGANPAADQEPYHPVSDDPRSSSSRSPTPERPDEYTPMQRSDAAVKFLSAPHLWITACLNFNSLRPGTFLDFSVINLFLLHHWLHHSTDSHVRFVDAQFSGSWQMEPHQQWRVNAYVIPRFRRLSFLPLVGPCPFTPVIFVIHHINHFFVVLLDYPANAIYVVSRTSRDIEYDNWSDWNGYDYYSGICQLHGWEPQPEHLLTVFNVSWAQNGVDCGPFAVCIILGLMQDGVHYEPATRHLIRPTYICPQYIRLLMLRSVREICTTSHQDYLLLREDNPAEWSTWDITEHTETHYQDNGHQYLNRLRSAEMEEIHTSLVRHTNTCTSCRVRTHRPASTPPSALPRGVDRTTPRPLQAPAAEEEEEEVSAEQEQQNDHDENEVPLGTALENIRSDPQPSFRNVATLHYSEDTWKNVGMDRFPRPTPPVQLPDPVHPFWPVYDRQYDDYETCPTLEDFPPYSDTREFEYLHTYHIFNDNVYQRTTERSTWTRFVDYGYRILPRFGKMFYINQPMRPLDHILCTGTTDDYRPEHFPGPAGETYSLSRGLAEPVMVNVTDLSEMGIESMLEGAGDLHGSKAAQDIFVRGRTTDDNDYIRVNPELDAEDLSPENVDISVDIDSLIWVTDMLSFKRPVKVHLTPTIGTMSVLPKSNHVYVHLLMPPSGPEGLEGGRSEWIENRVPLSNIPHTRFASVVEGHGPFTVYIFFPRMRHKAEYTNRWAVVMPTELQAIFFDRVVIPAVRGILGPEAEPYVGYTVDEFKLKSASRTHRKGNPARAKMVDITPEHLTSIQRFMDRIITDSPSGLLDRYGSFFFLLEGKGTKLSSQVNLSTSDANPWDVFKHAYPVLDTDTMLSQPRGELIVDVGVSFVPRAGTPVVGLWRLDALEASYGRGGYSRGKLHTGNTLARYGGLQAEMLPARGERTHIAFRSSYNLYYEATRTQENRPLFSTDGDAYMVNEAWNTDCNRIITLYEGSAQQNSYGARDEYRIGGQVILPLMARIKDMAITFLQSQPILWIKSKLWFSWLARRMHELMAVQISLYHRRPANYGLITGVITHLLRSVETTPMIVPAHVMRSLGELRLRQIRSRFGMMFLHNLDINASAEVLIDIEDTDSQDVFAALKIQKKFNPRRMPQNSGPSVAYPLGEYPTWNAVQAAVRTEPWNVIQQYRVPNIRPLMIVRRAFQSFTEQMWDSVNTIHLSSAGTPPTGSLSDAMESWSVGRCFDSIMKVNWEAINTGRWNSIRGPREASFRERAKWYFPPSREVASQSPAMQRFYLLHTGYLSRFWADMASTNQDEQEETYNQLEEIFSSIQCLPATGTKRVDQATLPTSVWQIVSGSIRIVVNPLHYMIKGIGNDHPARKAGRSSKAINSERNALQRQLQSAGVPQRDQARLLREALGEGGAKHRRAAERRSTKAKNARRPPRMSSSDEEDD